MAHITKVYVELHANRYHIHTQLSFDLQSVNTYSHSRINLYYSIEYLNVMEDYRLPEPLVGMLRASKLTGKPIVKTELLATKLHVTLSWDLATSAPKKTKKRQYTKTAKPAPTTQQPAKSSPRRQPPAPTPAPAAAAPAPEPTVVHQPCPKTLPPQVAAGRVGDQPMDQRSQPTPTPAAKALPRRQTRLQKTTLPRFNAAPRHNRLTPSMTHP